MLVPQIAAFIYGAPARRIAGLFLLLLLGSWHPVAAQGGTTVTGTLLAAPGQPAEFATVSLLQAPDSAFVKGGLSNAAGDFAFAAVKPGQYVLKVTALGFRAAARAFTVGVGAGTVALPPLLLRAASYALGGVTVTATPPLVERQADRLVVNVAGSVLAAGNNALEVLQQAPGITVDQDNNISLNGKVGTTVMLNDKLTYLSAAQLATLLRATDGNTIQSIELISNPSAKYDAAGNAGIINIKLKETRRAGTNGTLTLGLGQGYYLKDNASLDLSRRAGRWNVFGAASHLDTRNYVRVTTNRAIDSAGRKTYFSQFSTNPNTLHTNSYRAGADYAFSARHTGGVVVSGYANAETNRANALTAVGPRPEAPGYYQNTRSHVDQTYRNFALNLNDRLQLDTLGRKLDVDVDYARFANNSDEQYNTFGYRPDGGPRGQPFYLRQQAPATVQVRTAKADYAHPFAKTAQLEAGAKFSDVTTANELAAQTSADDRTYQADAQLSNRFNYAERIGAAYLSLAKSYVKTSVRVGLRAENTHSESALLDRGRPAVTRDYLDFFPSAALDYAFSDQHQLGLSAGRRIDRPSYDDLNPFTYYLDRYTRLQGNPFLRPQYTTNVELHYTFHKTLGLSLSYGHTAAVNTQIILTDTLTALSTITHVNLNSRATYSFNANAPYVLAPWWSGNVNGTLFYSKYTADASVLGFGFAASRLGYNLKALQRFRAGAYKLELLAQYRSSQARGLNYYKANGSVDAGVSRSFSDQKMTLKLSVSDIFNTLSGGIIANYPSSQLDITEKYDTRVARLSFTYSFGNNQLKSAEHPAGNEDERGRVKGAD